MDYETVSIVRERPADDDPTDRYGNEITAPSAPIPVARCLVAFANSDEPVSVGRSAVITQDTVYMPDGTDVRATDSLIIRGDSFQVMGDPQPWIGAGVVVACKRVTG